jgi:probable rRNA maturation factor
MSVEVLVNVDDVGQQPTLKEAAEATLLHLERNGEATVVLTSDDEVRRLARRHLGADQTTDVLSFPHHEMRPGTVEMYLGDVVISLPRATEQAQAAGHALESELMLLTVHGMLHLLGFDHASPNDKLQMWGIQGEILEKLGCEITHPTDV